MGIDRSLSKQKSQQVERQWRLSAALFESAIASSLSLEVVMARLYRSDPESLAHLHRVATYSRRIGQEVGLTPRALDDLERAALIHDLGRVVLPDLMSPTVERREGSALRHRSSQVQLAYELTKDLTFLSPAADIVAASLEFFDGSGQPHGRHGSEIPIGARILAVADVLDAMTSVCLALSYSTDSATAEIVRQSGTRFDPEVVKAWLRCGAVPLGSLQPWWQPTEQFN
jgi:response regulator RpfG family c-di-GMP phosphodiesterase